MSINTVLKGVLKPGDHVICSCLEHNAVARPLNKLVKNGISFDKATVFTGDFDATVRSFEALIKKQHKNDYLHSRLQCNGGCFAD